MINSMNNNIDCCLEAVSYNNIVSYGKMMIGNKSLEYYNDKNINDYLQIPWVEIENIEVNLLFNKKINRFTIKTKKDGNFAFSTQDNKKALREVIKHIDKEKLYVSETLISKIIKKIRKIFIK